MDATTRIACLALMSSCAIATAAPVKVGYVMTAQDVSPTRPTQGGEHRVQCEIDGTTFRTVDQRGAVELSDDDGATTYFGVHRTAPQTPLLPDKDVEGVPIRASLAEDHLTIGPSSPGPVMFGLPTRVYTVDHDYAVGVHVLRVFNFREPSHARYTITVADIDASSAALRVSMSRWYPHVLAFHREAFTGLPLRIDGTIENKADTVRFHVEAESLER